MTFYRIVGTARQINAPIDRIAHSILRYTYIQYINSGNVLHRVLGTLMPIFYLYP